MSLIKQVYFYLVQMHSIHKSFSISTMRMAVGSMLILGVTLNYSLILSSQCRAFKDHAITKKAQLRNFCYWFDAPPPRLELRKMVKNVAKKKLP